MALSNDAVKRLMTAMSSADAGNEVASAINNGLAAAAQGAFIVPTIITATSTSTTTNFADLAVGDIVLQIRPSAATGHFMAVATAGTLPEAAVISDKYVVLRAYSASTASNVKF